MGLRVHDSIVYYWQPGQQAFWLTTSADAPAGADPRYWGVEDVAAREAYEKWVKRNLLAAKYAVAALAGNASIMTPDTALTFMKVSTIARAIERSVRATQYILRRLEEAREIAHTPCDGSCGLDHGQTDHWIIPRPPSAPEWGWPDGPRERKRARAHTRSSRKRGGAA